MNWRSVLLHLVAVLLHAVNIALATGVLKPIAGAHPMIASALIFLGQCLLDYETPKKT